MIKIVCAAWLAPAALALQWTNTEAVLRPQADRAMPVASYGFRNDTGAAMTIIQAVPSCDCTTVELVARRAKGVMYELLKTIYSGED